MTTTTGTAFTFAQLVLIGEQVAAAQRTVAEARLDLDRAEAAAFGRLVESGKSATAAEKLVRVEAEVVEARRHLIAASFARDIAEARTKAARLVAAHPDNGGNGHSREQEPF